MPGQEDFVTKALRDAKGALASANNSNVSTKNGQPFAPKKPTASPVKPAAKPTGLAEEADSAGKGIAERMKNEAAAKDAIKGSFKKGGTVPETGNYKLHKDEEVIPADKAKKMRKASEAAGALSKHGKAKHGVKHTHIEHHADGSHTVRHKMHDEMDESGAMKKPGDEVSYAAPDMDALHDGMEQHLGEPDGDEASQMAAGAPAEGAAPAAGAADAGGAAA